MGSFSYSILFAVLMPAAAYYEQGFPSSYSYEGSFSYFYDIFDPTPAPTPRPSFAPTPRPSPKPTPAPTPKPTLAPTSTAPIPSPTLGPTTGSAISHYVSADIGFSGFDSTDGE